MIPRQETSVLVELRLYFIKISEEKIINLLEIGVGSGIISLSILKVINIYYKILN